MTRYTHTQAAARVGISGVSLTRLLARRPDLCRRVEKFAGCRMYDADLVRDLKVAQERWEKEDRRGNAGTQLAWT
jgi:hypothetical protein